MSEGQWETIIALLAILLAILGWVSIAVVVTLSRIAGAIESLGYKGVHDWTPPPDKDPEERPPWIRRTPVDTEADTAVHNLNWEAYFRGRESDPAADRRDVARATRTGTGGWPC